MQAVEFQEYYTHSTYEATLSGNATDPDIKDGTL